MCNYHDELTQKYRKFPEEANADAWALQDACNLAGVSQTFMCMARACDFKYDNPAVIMTLDKMNSMCHIQSFSYHPDQQKILDDAADACMKAHRERERMKKVIENGI